MLNLRYFFLWITLFLFKELFSQDANYWNNQYGPGGYFLPGAVVANNKDSGVLYYNPALLVNSKITLLSANATIYHADKIKIKDGAGTGYDLTSTNTGAIPAMVAGNIRLPFKKEIIIAYGIIQPPSFDFAASQRRDNKFNVLNDQYSPGTEYFVGQYLNQNSSSEFKLLASAGWKISNNVSIGVTLEGTRRKQTIDIDYYARTIVNPDAGSTIPLVSTDASYYVSYTHLGLTTKIGLAWDKEKNHAGIMITLPNLRIGGEGILLSDNVLYNLDLTGTGLFPLSLFANSRQENLKATWKIPFSIAGGYTHDFERWQLYVSGEYFGKINPYNVITPRPEFFIRPDTGTSNLFTPDLLKLKDARKSVLNLSAGARCHLNEKYSLYVSLRSDNTYADRNLYKDSTQGFQANTTAWNIYHFQIGVNLKKPKFNLRVGIYTSYAGTNKYKQEINLDNPSETNFLLGVTGETKANYFSTGLMLSYVHNF